LNTVALLTDFGTKDSFVAAMKGVILQAAPNTTLVDITHEVPPQDIRFAAFQLRSVFRDFPSETLFVAVVDPGTGTDRKIIYAEAGRHRFLAPDNGLLSWALDGQIPKRILEIPVAASPQADISATFQGRDVFAPVAGRILNGEDPSTFGSPLSSWVQMPFPAVKKVGSLWTGEVLCVDVFGNVITNFPSKEVESYAKAAKVWIEFGKPPITIRGLSPSYARVEKGKLLAVAGSAGFLEISIRDGSAAQLTKLKSSSPVQLHFRV
jgi:S-adenosylmethionine hydrolase